MKERREGYPPDRRLEREECPSIERSEAEIGQRRREKDERADLKKR